MLSWKTWWFHADSARNQLNNVLWNSHDSESEISVSAPIATSSFWPILFVAFSMSIERMILQFLFVELEDLSWINTWISTADPCINKTRIFLTVLKNLTWLQGGYFNYSTPTCQHSDMDTRTCANIVCIQCGTHMTAAEQSGETWPPFQPCDLYDLHIRHIWKVVGRKETKKGQTSRTCLLKHNMGDWHIKRDTWAHFSYMLHMHAHHRTCTKWKDDSKIMPS